MVSSLVDLTNRSQQAHGVRCKLLEGSQQGHSVSSFCVSCEADEWLQNELAVNFLVSAQCVAASSNSSLGTILLMEES